MIDGQFSLMNKINFTKQKIKSFIPKEIYNYIMLHKLNRLLIARLIHVIKNLYPKIKYCNICGWEGKYFFQDTRCPICFSLPRHRFLGYIISEIVINKKKNVLLIGSDMAEILLFKKKGFKKVTILNKEKRFITDLVCDITSHQLVNDSFDLIIMWHVLEHIHEDRLAVENVFHLLRDKGHFIFSVPIFPKGNKKTYKPKYGNIEDRTQKTGHPDHVICCGKDYADRFSKLNFNIKKTVRVSDNSRSEIEKYHLNINHYAWHFEK